MFCVTMWPLFNLSPSGGGLPVGAGLGRRQPPRGAAGRGQQRCPVLVLLWHADVQGGPGAGENQRRAGPRQVTAPTHPPPNVWVQGARRGTAQPARLEGTPLDCCCVGGRRRGACGGAGGAWERAGAVRGETGVAKQTASCPASRIVSEPACSLCGTGRACCGSDAACPTAFLPVCPAPCRRLPDQAPSQWESLLSSPPWPVAALI